MANWKKVTMTIHTGYAGATHEDEFELDIEGLTEREIEKEINKAMEDFVWNNIETSYEIEE